MNLLHCIIGLLCLNSAFSWPKFANWLKLDSSDESEENWTGRWFPERTTEASRQEIAMEGGGGEEPVKMGVADACDDGKSKLSVDFSGDMESYTCMHPRVRFQSDPSIAPIMELENIPPTYQAQHKCMNETISYSSNIPTFGTHRQLWPIYGEYKFVPTQRWLHTLEHGGIVALYHPCADLRGIKVLKDSVKSCLRRHVITPLATLDPERPFALVAWGVRLRMPWVSRNAVRGFIQSYALKGPERTSKEGQFEEMLTQKAELVSDADDSELCPSPLAHD